MQQQDDDDYDDHDCMSLFTLLTPLSSSYPTPYPLYYGSHMQHTAGLCRHLIDSLMDRKIYPIRQFRPRNIIKAPDYKWRVTSGLKTMAMLKVHNAKDM